MNNVKLNAPEHAKDVSRAMGRFVYAKLKIGVAGGAPDVRLFYEPPAV
jgi:hypothetical protein